MRKIALVLVATAAFAALVPAANHAATAPAAPAGATGIALAGRVQVAWQPVVGATGYTVYRGTSAGAITTNLTGVGGVTGTSYTDTTAATGTTYYYAVRAVSSGVESGNSLVVQAKPVAQSCSVGNPIVLENCFPGNSPWNVRNTATIAAGGIEGYATAQSINRGDSLPIKVNSSSSATFNVEIYRSGYYGGSGARLFSVIQNVPGTSQPSCFNDSTTGLLDCSNWSVSTTITTTSNWPTGIYLVRIVRNDTGTDNQIMFVIRDDSSHSDLVYGTAISTFEAYNNYGGKSLYTFNSSGNTTVSGTPRAVKVSFDRPFEQPRSGLRDWYTNTEFATVSWLEEMGYDVSYMSNTDLETNGALLLNHKAYLSPAHDEYVSSGMRTSLENARDHGINLFFTGSNEVYWRIRFENSPTTGTAMRTEVCYKTVESGGPDPSGISTSTWRDPNGPNNPENALTGEEYIGDNDTTYFPFVVSAAQGTDRIYRDTPLATQTPGTSTSIGRSLVGWEWDARVANGREPAGVKTLSGSPVTGELVQNNGGSYVQGQPGNVSMVKYTAASGALVLTTGTNHWNRGLALNAFGVGEPDQRIQQVTTNILEDMGAVPQTPSAGIVLDNPQNRPPAPTGVTAAQLGTDSVGISWSAVPNATGYNVYRSLAPRQGGEPLGSLANSQLVSTTSFTDIGLASATTYYYVVTAVVAGVQSLASNEAQATTMTVAGQALRLNAGGPAYTSSTGAVYAADNYFSGGTASTWSGRAITGTTDPALYQDERWGQFTYNIPVANGVYDVRFHFAELYYGTAVTGSCIGKRVFGMDVLNTSTSPDLANIDICAAVGPNAAYDRTVSRVNVTNGVLSIKSVYGCCDDPEVTAIEVIPDQVAPSVTATMPTDGSKDIPVSSTVTARFSEAMDATTVTPSSFALKDAGGTTVPGTVSYDAGSYTATFTPTSPLAFGTTYTATVSTAAHASDGTSLAAPVSWSFTTHEPHPPGVISTFPAGGATGVSPFTSVQASFDQPIDPTTVTSSSFTLSGPSGTVPATVSYASASQTATLVPQQELATATTYTVVLASTITGATDGVELAGNVSWSFTTAAVAPAPPTVTPTPADGATGVSVTSSVRAAFSRDMNAASISASTFTLSTTGGAVPGTVSYDATSRTVTLTPTASLAANTTYTATLAASVLAADGTPLGSPVSWSFTTLAAPTVTGTSPVDGATYTSKSGPVTVTFSRAMDAATLTASSFTVAAPSGATAPATVSYDSSTNTATLTPTQLLAGGTTYTATVTTAARGVDGTPLAQPYTWSFTTAACPCSLFPDALQPATTGLATQDGRTGTGPWSYELGTKFTVDEPMQLTSFRFYKSPGETGTHIGKLWSSTGTLLASQQFATETASGWQVQALATPFTLQPGLVYTVSVNANAFFVSTRSGLATQIVSGPVRTVADGANGDYGASAGVFPTSSFSSSNYFADGVFVPSGDPGPLGVITTTPAANATSVSRTTPVTVRFSRTVDPTTLTSSSFQVSNAGGPVAGTIAYSDTTQTATFTPAAALDYSTAYTVKLTTAIRARDGVPLGAASQWTFTTLDPVRPTVVRTVPAAGATDATQNVAVSATFSKDMDPTTLTVATFTLTGPSGPVGGTVAYNSATFTATFTPSAPLAVGSTYTAALSASIAAADASTLGTAYTWSFSVPTTAPAPPSVTSTAPANGATLVSRTPTITAVVSRSLDPTTVASSTVTLATGGTAVPATVAYNDSTKTITLTPNAQLLGSTVYTATITTGVKAIDGTAFTAPYTWSFTTAACPCSLFSTTLVPTSVANPTADGRTGTGPFTYELGVKLTVDQTMQLTAIRFYKSPQETGTHVGRVWTSGGVQLAQVTFTGESASGWQVQSLGTPLTLQTGSVYVISVNANAYFVSTKSGLATQVVSGPLRSVADGKNGVFATTAGQFPSSTYSSSNYFVDVVASPGGATPAPTVTSTSPASGANGVATTTKVSATFSRSMDGTSLTSSTVTLTGPGGAVPASLSYDTGSNTVTLTPSSALSFNAVYTARIDGAARASDGTALGTAYSWSFTTANAVAPQVTQTVPANGATNVNTGVVVKADFSKALNPATVSSSTVKLTGPSGAVAGTAAYNSSLQEVSFTPTAALAPGNYTTTLSASIAATDGATMGTAYSWGFTVPATPVPLTVAPGSPAAGDTGVTRDSTVSAVFSRDITASTVTTTTFSVTDSNGAVVPATVSYDATSRTATLSPSTLLAAGAVYTVQLGSGIHTDDGTALSGTTSWQFTTGPCPCSVFPASATPSLTGQPTQDGRSGTGPWSYELGMRFTVDSAAKLTAIRFWKDSRETGSHTGTLWASDGTKIATVTFSNETASGWQQASFSSPVQLQTGTTYVVSYNANAFFVDTPGGLTASQGTGPLHTVVGTNGVYGSAAGTFPTSTFNSSNYWVDVVVK